MYKPVSFRKHVSSRAHVVYSIAYVLVEMGELEFGLTKRGKQTVIHSGFEYWMHRKNIVGQVTWRCCQFQVLKCPAMIKTAGNHVISVTQHTHEGNVATSRARTAVNQMKMKMTDNAVTPRAAQAAIISQLSGEVKMALPDKNVVARSLRRYRQACNKTAPSVLPPLPTDRHFDVPERYRDLVLCDLDPDTDIRILILGESSLLEGLRRSPVWLADGTFKKCPTLFFQVYAIHYELANGINPVGLICLLPNKTGDTYRRLLDAVKVLIPDAQPDFILTDFEIAAMEAFRAAYPNSTVTGCYFHLCQAVLRKTQELGLRPLYDSDDEVRGMIRCLPSLAHVPVDDVVDAFDDLASAMPQHHGMDELLTYFEHTYIRGRRLPGRGQNYRPALYSPASWNKRDSAVEGISRTTNICEGWHNSLQSLLLCSHPSMWTFFDGIKKETAMQTASFLQAAAGSQRAPKKRYTDLKERVIRAMENYGRCDRLTFLRAMAHLSWA